MRVWRLGPITLIWWFEVKVARKTDGSKTLANKESEKESK